MGDWILLCHGTYTAGTGQDGFQWTMGDIARQVPPNEAFTQIRARHVATLKNMWMRIITNAATGSGTLTSRKNGGAGSQTITISAGATGSFEDTTNTDSLVVGDLWNTRFVAGTGGSTRFVVVSMICSGQAYWGLNNFNSVNFAPIGGSGTLNSSTETDVEYTLRVSATVSKLRAYVQSNTRNGISTIQLRKNQGNANQSLSVPANTAGEFEDTTNTDSYVAADEANLQRTQAGTSGSMAVWTVTARVVALGRQLISADGSPMSVTAGASRFMALEGLLGNNADANTESRRQVKARVAYTAKNLYTRITLNQCIAASTLALRVNGSNSILAISIPATTTGIFEDTSNTVNVVAADLLNYRFTGGGTYDVNKEIRTTMVGHEQSGTIDVDATPRSRAYILD